MIDRQQLETILCRRFPGATPEQVAAAANAIMGLNHEPTADRHCGESGGACESCRKSDADERAPSLPQSSL